MTRPAPAYIAVIGPGDGATGEQRRDAHTVGAALAHAGAVLLTGGGGGVMRAAAAGCASAGGTSVGILPDADRTRADGVSTLTIPTGMGELRNGLLVRAADAVICVALSWGTLSEVALAVRTGVPVVVMCDWDFPLTGPIQVRDPVEAAARVLAEAARGSSRLPLGVGGQPVATPPIHHLTLTVTDVDRSAEWYQSLLGPAATVLRSGPEWTRIRMQWESGLVIGVTAHRGTPATDRFDHTRVGLDHVGLACRDEAEVRRWAEHFDRIGAPHGPVEEASYGWAVTGRDPDNVAVEFYAARNSSGDA